MQARRAAPSLPEPVPAPHHSLLLNNGAVLAWALTCHGLPGPHAGDATDSNATRKGVKAVSAVGKGKKKPAVAGKGKTKAAAWKNSVKKVTKKSGGDGPQKRTVSDV